MFANTENDATKLAFQLSQLDKNLKVARRWAGSGKEGNDYEALIVDAATKNLGDYAKTPVAAVIGKAKIQGMNHALCFPELNPQLIAELKENHKGMYETVKKVFEQFDTDASGFIDREELVDAVNKLGVKLQEKDVDFMIRDLDLNGDGKIDFKEFCHWWLTGRRGMTDAMRKLVSGKI